MSQRRSRRIVGTRCFRLRIVALLTFLAPCILSAQDILLGGRVVDPGGNALPNVVVQVLDRSRVIARTNSSSDGSFQLHLPAQGEFLLQFEAAGFSPVSRPFSIRPNTNAPMEVVMAKPAPRVESITVVSDTTQIDIVSPDPAQHVYLREEMLDANPGRPGVPVSVPGYPIETASGGIKAPQYFAPGVSADHGESIAQLIANGGGLVPNNLSANAHGNGYSDPNIFIPQVLQSVQIDGGAFNVREGNHSVNLAATYGLRSEIEPFVSITGDYRDIDVVGGLSPSTQSWIALEGSLGNGLLDRLEHRQQYKFNIQEVFRAGSHRLTLLGIGYYGQSDVPGLVPVLTRDAGDAGVQNLGDTIDPRQKDQTHTGVVALNDAWELSQRQQLQLSTYFRTYNLSLYSNFGEGLIRQSEFRTVAGSSAAYINKIAEWLSLLGGIDYEREAPRRDDLDKFLNPPTPESYGPPTPVTANNVTISSVTPYLASEGSPTHFLRYYLGWRRDEIAFDNQDLLQAQNSFQKWVGVNSPKATLAFRPMESWYAPLVSLSFGQAFFTNDPRIGSVIAGVPSSPVSTARSYQAVASKTVRRTDVRLTLGHVTTSATLAKLDPDTGLPINQGPGRLRYLSLSLRQTFKQGSILATFSKADARDVSSGQPTPEAPRTIVDFVGTIRKLPLRLQARGEFEYVGAKPLGTGCLPLLTGECTGGAVKEFRGALLRSFGNGRLDLGLDFLLASGYRGLTTGNFSPSTIQEVVGVRIPSYVAITVTYGFGRPKQP